MSSSTIISGSLVTIDMVIDECVRARNGNNTKVSEPRADLNYDIPLSWKTIKLNTYMHISLNQAAQPLSRFLASIKHVDPPKDEEEKRGRHS